MKETTKINDLFVVYGDETLIVDYQNILIDLYQPFVGAIAVSLYHTLTKYKDSVKPLSFHKLVISLGCDLADLKKAFINLEATNLVKTYIGNIEGFSLFVYQLNSPLSVYQFLKDPSLVQVLTSYIGPDIVSAIQEKEQQRTQYLEKIEDLENISHLLKDVFREELIGNRNQKITEVNEFKVENQGERAFHFDTFLIMLPRSIRVEFDFNVTIKNLLLKLAEMYNLTSEEMAIIFNLSLQKGQGIITEDLLRKEAYDYMIKSLRSENIKQQNEVDRSNNDVDQVISTPQISNKAVKQALYQMKKLSTFDYIKMITDSLTPQDYKNVERLIIDYHLSQEVANVLINYVYYDKHTLALPLMEAIAQNWHKRKISTAEEAYLALKENTQKSKENTTKKAAKTFDKRTEKISNFDDQKLDADDKTIEELFRELGE